MGIKKGKIKYSDLIELTRLNPVKIYLILKVLASEKLIKYLVDFDSDSIDIEILPKPDAKLNLEENKIIECIADYYKSFVDAYNL